MTNPPTGPTPSQDPTFGQGFGTPPASGGVPAQPTSGSHPVQQPASGDYQQPQYGQQPAYGQPQYGQDPSGQYGGPQYGGPQYGQQPGPQYGAPPQYGYPVAPQAYGQASPSGNRPGTATAAAVLGFIFGTIGFFVSAYALVGLTGASESGIFGYTGNEGDVALVLTFISLIAIVIASVLVFVGAVQLLSGKTNKWMLISTGLYIVGQLISLIAVLIVANGDGIATLIVSFIIALLLAGVLLFLSKSSDVEKWIARKNAARAAGYEL